MTICMLPIAGRLLTDSLFSIVIVVLVHTMVLKVGDFDCSVTHCGSSRDDKVISIFIFFYQPVATGHFISYKIFF